MAAAGTPDESEAGDGQGHRVFVYGSLKRGGSNHGYLAEADFRGEAEVEGLRMWDTGRGFPACTPGEATVRGEVYVVDDATLLEVDALEGVPAFYERRRMDGMWVYVWAGDPEPGWEPVPDGEWPVEG